MSVENATINEKMIYQNAKNTKKSLLYKENLDSQKFDCLYIWCPFTPLWNNEITPNGLAQKGSTDFYKLETKSM